MSKYDALWAYVADSRGQSVLLTFSEIRSITGFEIDHSFLNYKKELAAYGYQVGNISLKDRTVLFQKLG